MLKKNLLSVSTIGPFCRVNLFIMQDEQYREGKRSITMVIEFWINKIIYLGKQYKVLIPTIQNKNTYIVESDSKAYMLYANKNDLIKLAGLLVFATQNKDTIIYLPTKQNKFPEYLKNIFEIDNGLDLVIFHHKIQVKHKLWKEIRKRLIYNIKQSFKVNEFKFNDLDWEEHRVFYYKENKDFLDVREQFDTVFMVGSSKVFSSISSYCLSVAENGEVLYRFTNGFHEHEHLDTFTRHKGNFEDMTIDFYDEELWGE